MSTKIKICGLKRTEDIDYVNEAKPDYCGFIIGFPKSIRNVTKEQVRELVQRLNSKIIPVGVFVNADISLPAELLMEGTIAAAQLHGQEDDDYIDRLKCMTGKPVMKAFSIKCAEDVQQALTSHADYILLDQGTGGTGKTFDWSLVWEIDRPWFLAGGLGTGNLRNAIERLHPYAVDLSSSLETDGKKDREKIKEAVGLVRKI